VRHFKAKGRPSARTEGAPQERSAGERDHPEASRESGQTQDDERLMKAAKRREVKLRYDRARRRRHGDGAPVHRALLVNVKRAQINRLLRLRHRRHDDNQRSAADAAAADPSLSGKKLGEALQVTLEEKLLLGLHNIEPIDRTREQMRALKAELRRERDRRWRQKRRRTEQQREAALNTITNDVDLREEDLFAATDKRWRGISDLMRDIGNHKAWGGLTGDSLRRAMNRAATELVNKDMIEEKIEQDAKGKYVRLVRRVFSTATRKARK
jgi:hypothetical protein